MQTIMEERTVFIVRAAVVAVLLAVALLTLPSAAAGGHRGHSAVYLFSDGSAVPGASAGLVRTPNGVSMHANTLGLDPGSTYTVWWVVFNNPEFCENGISGLTACGEPDLFIPEVQAAVLYAAGNVVGASGRASFADSLMVGDLSGCQEPFASFGLCGDGLIDASGAEIHLVIRSHDALIPLMMPGMIHTFAGACTPETSLGAGDGPNACEDQQFAAFVP